MTQIINNELQVFSYSGRKVRTVQKGDEILLVLKDVCDVLGIEKHRDVATRLDDDERGSVLVDTLGSRQEMVAVNESGLFNVILLSRKPEAKRFKRWITHEVLPCIRRHGAYFTASTAEKLMNDPDTLITLLNTIKEERLARQDLQDQNDSLQAKLEIDRPKILFADSVSVSETAISISDLAKILKGNGCDIGQKRLFERLRNEGFLIRREGLDRNSPTQKAMELGLFRIKETAIARSDGRVTISKTSKVTGRGQQYFVAYFLSNIKQKEVTHAG